MIIVLEDLHGLVDIEEEGDLVPLVEDVDDGAGELIKDHILKKIMTWERIRRVFLEDRVAACELILIRV